MRILENRLTGLLIRVVVGIATGWLYWRQLPHMPVVAIPNLMTTLAGVFATLLGFIITAITLLASLLDKPLIRNMQKTGHYRRLMTDAFDTCMVLLVVVMTCLVGLMLTESWQTKLIAVITGLVMTAVLYLCQTGRRLFNIIHVLS
ncbi:hypothetical protein VC623_16560 [Citrobacter amalonaticus]|uniref:hypothetical protein n=1 Tax=Citrobacter amalonaticus TaxID=35703 RepID=UPI00292BD235|nr:hypothetical protein [Citrobacter amalonaticus]MDV0786230.1 hypothetical protein [Citrobacter amalonaticus]MEB0642293.1 hypothetical protein [Citrobacter amalonaticus]